MIFFNLFMSIGKIPSQYFDSLKVKTVLRIKYVETEQMHTYLVGTGI